MLAEVGLQEVILDRELESCILDRCSAFKFALGHFFLVDRCGEAFPEIWVPHQCHCRACVMLCRV
jgi:hypothetical protein